MAAAIASREEDDLVGHDLGRVLLRALLVRPLARLQPAFQVHLAPLAQVLTAQLGLLAWTLGNQAISSVDNGCLDLDTLTRAAIGAALVKLLGLSHRMKDLHHRNPQLAL